MLISMTYQLIFFLPNKLVSFVGVKVAVWCAAGVCFGIFKGRFFLVKEPYAQRHWKDSEVSGKMTSNLRFKFMPFFSLCTRALLLCCVQLLVSESAAALNTEERLGK